MKRRVLTLGVVSGLSVFLAQPISHAHACGQAFQIALVSVPQSVPANGALVLSWACVGGRPCSAPDELKVVDTSDDTMIAGKYRTELDLEGTIAAWQPDAPFIEGHTYEVENAGSTDGGDDTKLPTFVAAASISLDAEDVSIAKGTYHRVGEPTDFIECVGSAPVCGSVDRLATSETWRAQLSVEAHVAGDAEDATYGQFLTRVTMTGANGEKQMSPWAVNDNPPLRFDTAADEYCYQVEVLSLVDDSTAKLEGCIERTDDGPLGKTMLLEDDVDHELADCIGVISEKDMPRWCNAVRDFCNEDGDFCEKRLSECPADDRDDVNDEDDASKQEATPHGEIIGDDSPRACAVTSPHKHTPWFELGAGLLGLAFSVRRRVRRALGAR